MKPKNEGEKGLMKKYGKKGEKLGGKKSGVPKPPKKEKK